jgi:hypothetical protein
MGTRSRIIRISRRLQRTSQGRSQEGYGDHGVMIEQPQRGIQSFTCTQQANADFGLGAPKVPKNRQG